MLPQKPPSRPRKIALRGLIAWSTLPLLGVVAAFGVIPQGIMKSVKPRIQVQPVSLPVGIPEGVASTFWRSDETRKGESVVALLHRLDVADPAAERYLRHARAAAAFRRLKPGRAVVAETAVDGSLMVLRYGQSATRQIQVEKDGDGFAIHRTPPQTEQRIVMRTVKIGTSLFEAADAAGLPESTTSQLTDIFGGEIDFHHELRPGDEFSVVYDMTYSGGEPVQTGHILAAEFINRGRMYRAVYYGKGDHGTYYSPEGNSMLRSFLRAPVAYTRISSGYSAARFHPILHKWKAHRGIDFAAPMGTDVKATGDGTVAFAGVERGYGNVVILKHKGNISTVYAHLSRFARGLHRGEHVNQGEVIAYVGMTGWATGPHVHYEFRVNGTPRNPAKVAIPNDAIPINNTQRQAFLEGTHDLKARLRLLHNIALART